MASLADLWCQVAGAADIFFLTQKKSSTSLAYFIISMGLLLRRKQGPDTLVYAGISFVKDCGRTFLFSSCRAATTF